MGDHYLLPGALTARSARAGTEKNGLGYAASKAEMCRRDWAGRRGGRDTGGPSPSATLASTLPRAATQKRQKLQFAFLGIPFFPSQNGKKTTKKLVRVQKDKCCKNEDLTKTKCSLSFTPKLFTPSPCSMSEQSVCRRRQI